MDIREVIRTVREIEETTTVIVPRHQLITSIGDRLDVPAEMVLDDLKGKFPDGLKCVAIQPLKSIVESKIGKSITIREIAVTGDIPIYGYVEDYPDRAMIKVKSGMRPCWLRFTLIKELLHLYSDTCADAPNASADLLAMAARDSRYIVCRDDTTLDEETAAFYMALELAVPWSLREQFMRLRDLGATHYQIAKAFMVPEPFISHFIEGFEGNYAGLSLRLNRSLQ